MASQTDTILMSLPTPEVVKNVALGTNGIIAGSKIKTLVDLSTTGPHVAQELAKKLSENEINFVDSPVSGGVAGAKNGTLAVMLSCPKHQVSELQEMLQIIGSVFYVGEQPGLGQTMKLANNLCGQIHKLWL